MGRDGEEEYRELPMSCPVPERARGHDLLLAK